MKHPSNVPSTAYQESQCKSITIALQNYKIQKDADLVKAEKTDRPSENIMCSFYTVIPH